jgi:hypothetical protein
MVMMASRPSVEIRFFNLVMISWSMAALIRQFATISTAALAVKVTADAALTSSATSAIRRNSARLGSHSDIIRCFL